MRNREMTNNKIKINCTVAASIWMLCVLFADAYEIPEGKFKLLKPKGFQVSIPDESGLQLFAFHGNLNKKMANMETGQFSNDTIIKQYGKWIYQNRKLKVKAGDVIYYWLFVIKNGVGYKTDDIRIYEISDSDVYRAKKKSHKFTRRSIVNDPYGYNPYDTRHKYARRFGHDYHYYGVRPYGHGHGTYFPTHSSYSYGTYDSDSDSEEKPYNPLYGYPHHHQHHNNHQTGYHHGQGYGHGFHTSGYGSSGSGSPDYYHPHNHHHHWNHKANCNWPHHDDSGSDETTSESIPNNENNNNSNNDNDDEIENNEPLPEAEITDSEVRTSSSQVQTTSEAITIPTEEDAEIMTTTSAPQIDIRFGDKTK